MSWIFLSLISALLLGFYQIAKKNAVDGNAVPVVLLLNVMTAAVIWLPIVVWNAFNAGDNGSLLWSHMSRLDHGLLFFKATLVGSSWTLAFWALKHLPISIAGPIRSTSPIWTILFAVMLMGERPQLNQWIGVLLILIAFIAFSQLGRREGIHFHRDRWIGMLVAATLLGAASALYDKYLLQTKGMSPAVVQAWFSIYLVPVMLPLAIKWLRYDRARSPFVWRWSIPLIAIFLLVADYAYFTAIAQPDALISVISPLRRSSVVIAFLFGVMHLNERNWQAKAVCIAILLTGVTFVSL